MRSSEVQVPEAFEDHVENILLNAQVFGFGGNLAKHLVSEKFGCSEQSSHLRELVLLEVLSSSVERQRLS